MRVSEIIFGKGSKSGYFADQRLEFDHIVPQKVIKNTGADKWLHVDPDNLNPVGDKFHHGADPRSSKRADHPEGRATDWGRSMTEEAKAVLRVYKAQVPAAAKKGRGTGIPGFRSIPSLIGLSVDYKARGEDIAAQMVLDYVSSRIPALAAIQGRTEGEAVAGVVLVFGCLVLPSACALGAAAAIISPAVELYTEGYGAFNEVGKLLGDPLLQRIDKGMWEGMNGSDSEDNPNFMH